MSLTNSPSLDEYSDGIPPGNHENPTRKLIVRILIGIFSIFLLSMAVYSAKDSQVMTSIAGQGKVIGAVEDLSGAPVSAAVFYLGSEREVQTDAMGNFELSNVPAGEVALVIAKNGAAEEFMITVAAGETTNLGVIQYVAATPGP